MRSQVEKTNKEYTIKSVANSVSQKMRKETNQQQAYGFVDNRPEAKVQKSLQTLINQPNSKNIIVSTDATIQRKLFKPFPTACTEEQATRWNELLDKAEKYGTSESISDWAGQEELDMWTEDFDTDNAISELKDKIGAKLDEDKMDKGDSDGLGWGDIIEFIDSIGAKGYCVVAKQNGPKDHPGTVWSVTAPSGAKQVGSVPSATHGLSVGALNGARGAVKTAIGIHNDAIDAVKAAL